MKREKNVKTIISVVIIVITLLFTGYILFQSSSVSEFYINEDNAQLEITGGVYNKVIDLNNDTQISIVSPKEILRRTNGSALGNTLKGTFTIEGDLSVYLNLSDRSLDWIEIINGEEHYYLNLKTEQETNDLYNDLSDFLNS